MGYPDSSTPTFMDYGGPAGAREAYPAWSAERQIPLSKEEIEDIFLDLTQKFGFQRDSMRNMVRFFVSSPPCPISLPCPDAKKFCSWRFQLRRHWLPWGSLILNYHHTDNVLFFFY
jgi:hypothetical protein